ncbi:TlpA family protein disulfide reductase [Aestuariirhabdus litorea]|uniref:TlpA family protein disulfide reductase n=1 Tax=Aestuariirhabdus litorea TaxID=2528527 RepID=A0A3P3VNH5_9GAMM|nr:TlpA disulfide reductase family protein [Aestuariirhabdus litorea]RRJ84160.1 TlpA family protein disulfide reductase [Aestuariirhabdus litorea]RWW97380.1 redoxin domain-containing protein [Endozoicomonadaceae bacterium GTF-13]
MRIVPLVLCCLISIGCSDSSFYDQHGHSVELATSGEGWTVINYWAQWCEPCRHEIPELNRLHHADNGVRVLGVSFDGADTPAELGRQIGDMGIEFPVLDRDPAAELGRERPLGLPSSWLLNSAGEVVEQRLGPQTEAELLALITGYRNEGLAEASGN